MSFPRPRRDSGWSGARKPALADLGESVLRRKTYGAPMPLRHHRCDRTPALNWGRQNNARAKIEQIPWRILRHMSVMHACTT